jgi:DNA repair exonuclease SbcCD ATPase subunit
MKILSLLLRLVTLAVLVALGAVWFLNKEELSAINEAYQRAGEELNVPDQPLSKVIDKGINELSQTRNELRQSQARAAGLEQKLTSTRDELATTEDQLRSTNQKLRNTQRELESANEQVAEAEDVKDRLNSELETVRNDLIRVNKEKFELSQRIESVEEEKKALARRVEQLEGMGPTTAARSTDDEEDEEVSASASDRIARLQDQLEAAEREIERLSNNPLSAALASASGGDETLTRNQVRVKSVNLDRGLIVLRPSPDGEFVGVDNLTVNRDGAPIAELKLRGVYPDYLVAEILPSSTFAEALETGSVYTFRK